MFATKNEGDVSKTHVGKKLGNHCRAAPDPDGPCSSIDRMSCSATMAFCDHKPGSAENDGTSGDSMSSGSKIENSKSYTHDALDTMSNNTEVDKADANALSDSKANLLKSSHGTTKADDGDSNSPDSEANSTGPEPNDGDPLNSNIATEKSLAKLNDGDTLVSNVMTKGRR